jgi:hypothetical protein
MRPIDLATDETVAFVLAHLGNHRCASSALNIAAQSNAR